jgi:hypothetical protein
MYSSVQREGVLGNELSVHVPQGEYEVGIASLDKAFLGNNATQAWSGPKIKIEGKSGISYWVSIKQKDKSAGVQPSTSLPQTSAIQQEIDRVAQGTHQDLPPPVQTSLSPGQNPGWTIENATGYQLNLYLSGPAERHYAIANGESINIDLPPGSYRIAADVSSGGVTPFYAVRQLNADTRWKSHFYIARQ